MLAGGACGSDGNQPTGDASAPATRDSGGAATDLAGTAASDVAATGDASAPPVAADGSAAAPGDVPPGPNQGADASGAGLDAGAPSADARPPAADASATPPKVQACAIVTSTPALGAVCDVWFAFGLDANKKSREGLVASFTPTATEVVATFAFEKAEQDGVVSMLLVEPRALKGVKVKSSGSGKVAGTPFLTLESMGGANGCGYAIAAGGEAQLATALYCWGDKFTPQQVAVHVTASAAGEAELKVSKLELR